MPFPKLKVHFNGGFGSCPREVVNTDPETGVTTIKVEDCNKPLPDAEMFEISNMIKAGVHLDEVNTKILSSGVDVQAVHEAVSSYEKLAKGSKQHKKEVNDEN